MSPEETLMGWEAVKHFAPGEFDSPDEPGSGMRMSLAFVAKLDKARELTGFPWKVNSGYRTPAHNAAVGGAPDSEHEHGEAVDIVALRAETRGAIIFAAKAAGILTISIGDTIVHLDDRPAVKVAVYHYHPNDRSHWF